MSKKFTKRNTIILCTVIILVFSWFFVIKNSDFNAGNKIINKIEEYRISHDNLPESLNDIGFKTDESSKYFYESGTNSKYVVYFSRGFDETWAYYSDSKEWEWGLDRSRIGK